MKITASILVTLFLTVGLAQHSFADSDNGEELIAGADGQWPMASGPNGSWTVRTKSAVPKSWSVTTGQGVDWKTELPEGGQSGIAVWNDRLFLTCNKPLPEGTPTAKASGTDIVGLCLDSRTGKILWSVPIPGTKPMQHSGLFADNSSPTPITDGKHVWFTNAGGAMACYDMLGKQVWHRSFEARTRHNAKQCEPMMIDDQILHVEMKDKTDPTRREMKAKPFSRNSDSSMWPWTFLRSFDAKTGRLKWTAQAGTSVHNTPTHRRINGKTVAFHSRGGGHKPPETPYGFSLTTLAGDQPGATLWNFESKSGLAYFVAHIDENHAYCFESQTLIVLSLKTGKELKRISLNEDVTIRSFDQETKSYRLQPGKLSSGNRRAKPYPTNQTNIIIDGYCLFMSYADHFLGRVHIESGRVEYLQVPVQVAHDGPQKRLIWDKHVSSDTENSRGMNVAPDKRAKGDGWGHVTSASPIGVNQYVYFSTMLGTTYVVNAHAEQFDEKALISVNDSGAAGKTWTLSAPSYSQGKIYHRTLKNVVSITQK
jgi:outer membrane protein assembly factor BamB